MLERLAVSNLVVIRDAELELHPGLNVITGETGAGKTILTEALGLVLGGRADTALVGPGSGEAYVEATFAIPPGVLATDAFDGIRGLIAEPEEGVVLARRIDADGRSRALCNGRSATRAALEAAGSELVSVVSQHEARTLSRPAVVRRLLDASLEADHEARLTQMQEAWRALESARERLAAFEAGASDVKRRAEDLAAIVDRVEAVAPRDGETDELRAERDRLRHADQLLHATASALEALNPEEGEAGVGMTARAARLVADAAEFDPALQPLAAELAEASARLTDVAHELARYTTSFEHDPQRLDAVEARLAALVDLEHRHGSLAEALAAAAAARAQLDAWGLSASDQEQLRSRAADALAHATAIAADVTRARIDGAETLASAIIRHLADLGMRDATAQLLVQRAPLAASGADQVELRIAANQGFAPAPIATSSSGGELARIALAIRLAAHERRGVPVLVFDEIDAGVGGRTALAVAAKLRDLATSAQVVCVTHLAQIAARADRHFRVVKREGDPAVTRIETLTSDDIDAELARMLGGDEASSEALRLARSLRD